MVAELPLLNFIILDINKVKVLNYSVKLNKTNFKMKKSCTLALLILLVLQFLSSQERKVTGIVNSGEDNKPLTGASVIVKGTTKATVTDQDGKYNIIVPDGGVLKHNSNYQ